MLGKKTSHPTADELQAYYAAQLPGSRQREIEEHLVVCSQCVRHLEHHRLLAVALNGLASGPERPIDHRAALRVALAAAASRAARAAVKRRLATWEKHPPSYAGGVVHWRPAEPGSRSTGKAEWLTTFTGSSPWRLVPGPDNLAAAGASTRTAGGPSAFVRAAGPRELAVHVSDWVSGTAAPLVLIAREIGLESAVVKQTRLDLKTHTQSACFNDLKPGRYLLGLEPLAATDPS